MSITDYQEKVDQWIQTTGVRYFDPLTNTALLMEEVGEFARIMARKHGEQSFKEGENNLNVADELADILFVVCCLANQHKIDLEQAVLSNLDKKSQRDGLRHKQNPKLS